MTCFLLVLVCLRGRCSGSFWCIAIRLLGIGRFGRSSMLTNLLWLWSSVYEVAASLEIMSVIAEQYSAN